MIRFYINVYNTVYKISGISTGKSKEIFDLMIADKDIRYQYFSGEKIGLDAASLFLFEHAIGEFVWLFSDDDEILSGSILEVNKLITSDPNLNLVWANFDSDLPGGLAVKNRNSGYFRDGSEALEVIGTGIGFENGGSRVRDWHQKVQQQLNF
jgi:hypothetical protein